MGKRSFEKLTAQEVGKVLKDMRESGGLTQVRVSEILGKGQDVVSKFENGKHYPRLDKFLEWAEICGCEVNVVGKVGGEPYTIMKFGNVEKDIERMKNFSKKVSEKFGE